MSWTCTFEVPSTVGLFGIRERFDERAKQETDAIIAGQIKAAGLAVERLFEQLHNGEAHGEKAGKLYVNAVGHVFQPGTSPSFINASVTYEEQSQK